MRGIPFFPYCFRTGACTHYAYVNVTAGNVYCLVGPQRYAFKLFISLQLITHGKSTTIVCGGGCRVVVTLKCEIVGGVVLLKISRLEIRELANVDVERLPLTYLSFVENIKIDDFNLQLLYTYKNGKLYWLSPRMWVFSHRTNSARDRNRLLLLLFFFLEQQTDTKHILTLFCNNVGLYYSFSIPVVVWSDNRYIISMNCGCKQVNIRLRSQNRIRKQSRGILLS